MLLLGDPAGSVQRTLNTCFLLIYVSALSSELTLPSLKKSYPGLRIRYSSLISTAQHKANWRLTMTELFTLSGVSRSSSINIAVIGESPKLGGRKSNRATNVSYLATL